MNKRIIVMMTAVLFTVLWTLPVFADESSPHHLSGTVTFATDYYWRGMTQTDHEPSVQASLDYEHASGFYAGIWGGNYNGDAEVWDDDLGDYVTDTSNDVEIDFYVGYWRKIGKIELDLMATYYHYPGSVDSGYDADMDDWIANGAEADCWELHIGLAHTFNLPTAPKLSIGYDYTPDYFGEDGTGQHVNALLELDLPFDFVLALEGGYQDVAGDKQTGTDINGVSWGLNGEKGFDYKYYRIGISREIFGVDCDLSFHSNSENTFLTDSYGVSAKDQLIFTVSYTF